MLPIKVLGHRKNSIMENVANIFVELIESNGLSDLKNWNEIKVNHTSRELFNKTVKEIDKNQNGLYCYFDCEKCLYVGKGKPILKRLQDHFSKCISEKPLEEIEKYKAWYAFFRQYRKELTVYYVEFDIKDKTVGNFLREAVESYISNKYQPEFISFQKSFKDFDK
jgi:hypothetical protein